MSKLDIISYFGELNAPYVHAGGKKATQILLSRINCQAGDKVLEIGCGTGATLVNLSDKFPRTNFTGLESSRIMLEKARKRISLCGKTNQIKLNVATPGSVLPFTDNSLDIVYTESVLGIQEGGMLPNLLNEIFRILKPGGKLIFNETIWMDGTSLPQIESINQNCKKGFGIIQSNASFPYQKDWEDLLEKTGFHQLKVLKIDQATKADIVKVPFNFRSEFFSLGGRIFGRLRGELSENRRMLDKLSKEVIPFDRKIMQGLIIECQKPSVFS